MYEGDPFVIEVEFGGILVAQRRNLFDGRLPDAEWKKNLRMDRDVFMSPANEIRPYIQPGTRGLHVLSVEKQLALPLYFLKDKGSLSMTANAFGAAWCTVSVTVRKVCDVITSALGLGYINLPSAEQDMNELVKAIHPFHKWGRTRKTWAQ